jgi:hypothetical protein
MREAGLLWPSLSSLLEQPHRPLIVGRSLVDVSDENLIVHQRRGGQLTVCLFIEDGRDGQVVAQIGCVNVRIGSQVPLPDRYSPFQIWQENWSSLALPSATSCRGAKLFPASFDSER